MEKPEIGIDFDVFSEEAPRQIGYYGIKVTPDRVTLMRIDLAKNLDGPSGAQLYNVSWIKVKMPDMAALNGDQDDDEHEGEQTAWDKAQDENDGPQGPSIMMPFMMAPELTEQKLSEVAEAMGQNSFEDFYNATKTEDDPPYEEATFLNGLSRSETQQLFDMSKTWMLKKIYMEAFVTAARSTDLTMRMGAAYRSSGNDNNTTAEERTPDVA